MNDLAGQGDEIPDGPTTTHARPGDGRPRLRFVVGSENWDGTPAREFLLNDSVTKIGSADNMDLKLSGLLPTHAEITHDERDEYVLTVTGESQLSHALDNANPLSDGLRDGARVQLGEWQMFFQRDEFADHGRPYGGRQGGEFAHQQSQEPRESEVSHDEKGLG